MKTDNIYNLLSDYLKRSNKDSTNEVICRYIMNHLLDIPDMSVNEIAEACYTSHPSIIRFTRELGFDGIADLKYNIQDYIDEIRNKELRVSFPVESLAEEEVYVESLKNWLDSQRNHIVDALLKTDRQKIQTLCQKIHDHSKVVLVGSGLSQSILELFRIELARCGKIVGNIGPDLEALEAYEKEKTLLIVLSINGLFINAAKRNDKLENVDVLIKEHCKEGFLITMNPNLKSTLLNEIVIGKNEEEAIRKDDQSLFEYTLNATIVFFELVGSCYQEMFA